MVGLEDVIVPQPEASSITYLRSYIDFFLSNNSVNIIWNCILVYLFGDYSCFLNSQVLYLRTINSLSIG